MASNKLTITDLEFDDIKSNLKEYLSAQTHFKIMILKEVAWMY